MLKIANAKHCPECGTKYHTETSGLPEIECKSCEHIQYFNRSSITVLVVPTEEYNAVWLGRRKQNPGKGKWALPAGYSQQGETWRQTGARELFEEMNILVRNPEENIQNIEAETVAGNRGDLIFGIVNPYAVTVGKFMPNKETAERIKFMKGMPELSIAFPFHEKVLKKFFEKKYRFKLK